MLFLWLHPCQPDSEVVLEDSMMVKLQVETKATRNTQIQLPFHSALYHTQCILAMAGVRITCQAFSYLLSDPVPDQ